jgi:pimeloyl-ACP methyl ester carboxylesterase
MDTFMRAASSMLTPAALGLVATTAALAGLAVFNRARANRAERRNGVGGGFVEIEGVKLHYLSRGEGPPIVLLHGNGSMIHDWLISGQFDSLAQTHRIIAFDRPGFGFSDRPRSTVWTPEAQAALLAAAFTELRIERPTVVGHSFGTLVALALALDHPNSVSRLVLLGGYYYATARLDAVLGSGPAIPGVGDVMRYTVSPLLGKAMEPVANRKLFAPAQVTAEWKSEYPSDMAVRPSQVRAVAAETAMMVPAAARLSRRYHELSLPITIMAGEGDRVVDPARHSVTLHRELPRSELILIEGAGHMVHHTAGTTVHDAIVDRNRLAVSHLEAA